MGYWQFTGGQKWNGSTFIQNRETTFFVNEEVDRLISLNDEDLLLPGALDMHTHIWAPDSNIGVSDVQLYSEGVVGCADGGSFGCETWAAADRYWRSVSHQQIRSFMSLLPEGLINPARTPTDPEQIPMEQVIEVVENAKKTALQEFPQLFFISAFSTIVLFAVPYIFLIGFIKTCLHP